MPAGPNAATMPVQIYSGGVTRFRGMAGQETLRLNQSASPGNFITISGSALGGSPSIIPGGGDADVDLTLGGRGNGGPYLASPWKMISRSLADVLALDPTKHGGSHIQVSDRAFRIARCNGQSWVWLGTGVATDGAVIS